MSKRRPSDDGGVSLRKDGRWEGRKNSIKAPAPDQPKLGILLGGWLDRWYQSYKKANLRPNTPMSYERRIYQRIISAALGNVQMDKLSLFAKAREMQVLTPEEIQRLLIQG